MKRFYFTQEAKSVYGHQLYYADAETQEEAAALVEEGNCVFVSEELEVQDLGEPEFCSVEEIPSDECATPPTEENWHPADNGTAHYCSVEELAKFDAPAASAGLPSYNAQRAHFEGWFQRKGGRCMSTAWAGFQEGVAFALAARSSSPEAPAAYARATELEALKDPRIAGKGIFLNKEPREGFVPLYLAPPSPTLSTETVDKPVDRMTDTAWLEQQLRELYRLTANRTCGWMTFVKIGVALLAASGKEGV